MNETKTACIDLDGTIAHYKGWIDKTHFGDPISGVQEALTKLKSAGWKIIIFTTRGDTTLTAEYLNLHNIPYDHINFNPDQPDGANEGKPIASVYVDDRGISFKGNWSQTVDEVLNFSTWE